MNRDQFGRKINYLRLAVTFRCNLSCFFCSPGNYDCMPDDFELSDNAILKISAAAAKTGITKIRFTGGEPLLRLGVTDIAWQVGNLRGVNEVTLTTNGAMLEKFAQELRSCGIRRVNVNLPSLDERRFKRLTGTDFLKDVTGGIVAARKAGLSVKINVVVLSDMEEGEVISFSQFAGKLGSGLRFIEYMPLTMNPSLMPRTLPIETLREWISRNGIDAQVIAAMKEPFCGTCNRLRISSAGDVHPCLFGRPSHSLKEVLKGSVDDIARVLRMAISCKPSGHCEANDEGAYRPVIRVVGG